MRWEPHAVYHTPTPSNAWVNSSNEWVNSAAELVKPFSAFSRGMPGSWSHSDSVLSLSGPFASQTLMCQWGTRGLC